MCAAGNGPRPRRSEAMAWAAVGLSVAENEIGIAIDKRAAQRGWAGCLRQDRMIPIWRVDGFAAGGRPRRRRREGGLRGHEADRGTASIRPRFRRRGGPATRPTTIAALRSSREHFAVGGSRRACAVCSVCLRTGTAAAGPRAAAGGGRGNSASMAASSEGRPSASHAQTDVRLTICWPWKRLGNSEREWAAPTSTIDAITG